MLAPPPWGISGSITDNSRGNQNKKFIIIHKIELFLCFFIGFNSNEQKRSIVDHILEWKIGMFNVSMCVNNSEGTNQISFSGRTFLLHVKSLTQKLTMLT